MALVRFTLDLAIPQTVFATIPAARKLAFKNEVLALKALAVKINAGAANEEMTVKATFHTCRHDEGLPCEAEQDI